MRCATPQTISIYRDIDWEDSNDSSTVMQVPCGKCIPCLSNKRQEWIFRLQQEYKHSTSAVFITLTFDPKHYPSDGNLDKRHLQLYLKRLRKLDGSNKLRYYAVGEYGTESGRAHYHLLLFNLEDTSKARLAWRDSKGNSIGIVHMGKVTQASIAYVTKYIIQPFTKVEGRTKPFATMSRKYGIGGKYLTDEMVQWHKENEATHCLINDTKVRMPRFYKSKVFYGAIKERVAVKSFIFNQRQKQKEEDTYKKHYGSRWKEVKAEAELRMYQRIKVKIKYTQTL